MLVTHYRIALADDGIDAVRQRIAVIGPAFDSVPGLVAKLFLLATDTPCYALYYLWQTPDALHAFLDGPLFAALVQRFGRPTLHHYLTRQATLPFAAGDRIDCDASTAAAASGEVALDDLRNGERLLLRRTPHGRFEVVHIAGRHAMCTASRRSQRAQAPRTRRRPAPDQGAIDAS